jgi:hypothetical protein
VGRSENVSYCGLGSFACARGNFLATWQRNNMQIIESLKAMTRGTLELLSASAYKEARAVVRLEQLTPPKVVTPSHCHLEAAIGWLKRAHDSSNSGGVAWGYRARRPVRTVLPLGWVAPYPETTGYTIPTMLRFNDLSGDEDCLQRARRMTAWELAIQLEDGGIQGGTFGAQPVASSTFVTGQVLFGFLSAYNRFPAEAIRAGAIRAGEFLLDRLDKTGRFVRGYSQFCAPGAKAYEARTGLALAELGDLLDDQRFRTAASRIADYALSVQEVNGWFRENDLDDHDRPLTHTIGYVIEGLYGIGVRLKRWDCIEAVQRTLDHIIPLIRPDGFLAGRWRTDWTSTVDWACLTGSAQIAGVFLRMHEQTKMPEYLEAGRKLLGFVCFTQDLRTSVPELDGGIRGSYPFGGEYGQWCVLNWATKFFCDSVMDYLRIQGNGQR